MYDIDHWEQDYFEHKDNMDFSKLTLNGIHKFFFGNENSIDVLAHGLKNNNKCILVVFGGAVSNREEKIAPFFSGIRLSRAMNIPIISIADPVLSESLINLAWYLGSKNFNDLQDSIAFLLEGIFNFFNLDFFIIMGGSGGGYAALVQAMIAKNISAKYLIWNPQTSITEYVFRHVENYVNVAFGGKENIEPLSKVSIQDIFTENNIIDELNLDKINDNQEIIYLQNLTDSYHINKHMLPLLNKSSSKLIRYGQASFFLGKNKFLYVGNWKKGHTPPPNEIIKYIVDSFRNDIKTKNIVKNIEKTLISPSDLLVFYDDIAFDLDLDFQYLITPDKIKLKCLIDNPSDVPYLYSFYLIENNKRVESVYYKNINEHIFNFNFEIDMFYQAKIYVKLPNGRVLISYYELELPIKI